MLNLTLKKSNHNYFLSGLCALTTLVPVLTHILAVPGELVLSLAAWLLSNGLITALLFLHSRLDRVSPARS